MILIHKHTKKMYTKFPKILQNLRKTQKVPTNSKMQTKILKTENMLPISNMHVPTISICFNGIAYNILKSTRICS